MLADMARLRKDMDEVKKATGGMASAAEWAGKNIRKVFGGLTLGYAVREFVQTADAMANINSRLRLATTSAQEYETAQRDVYRISQANLTPLKETATLYSRLSDPVRKLGGDTSTTATIVESFAMALRISGATTAEASSATIQFSQAMASGVLRGEEFNSVNEGAPRVMQALESALGKTRGELRKMAEQGLLTSDVVGNALVSQFVALKIESQTMALTVGGAMQQLQNDVGGLVVAVNEATGATGGMADMVSGAAGLLREFTTVFAAAGRSAGDASTSLDLAGIGLAVIGRIIETVVLVGSDVAYVFRSVGIEIGGLAAQAAALVRGDFGQVAEIHRQMKIDAETNRAELDRFQTSVAGTTDRMLAQRDALKAGALSASENAVEMRRLMSQGTETAGALRASTTASVSDADAKKRAAAAAKEAAAAEKELKEAAQAMARVRAEGLMAQLDESDAVAEQVLRLREENAQIGLTKQQLRELERSRMDETLATAEQRLQLALSNGVRGEELEAITLQVEALRELKQAKEEGWAKQTAIEARDAAKETAVEWAKVTDQIGQGLTDSLFRAFEAGRGFFSTLWDGIKNLFKTTVLKLAMQPVQAGISSAVGGLLSGFSGTAAASGGSGITGMLGGLGSTIGTFGSDVLGSMMGAGTTGAYGGLASMVGTAMPYIAAAGAVYAAFKALKHKPTPHMGSAVSIGADGTARTLSRAESDILNNYNADTDAALRAMGGATVGNLNRLSTTFGGTGGFSASAAFAADGNDASIGKFLLSRNGTQLAGGVQRDAGNYKLYSSDREAAMGAFALDVASATRAALTAVGLPDWAREQFEKLGSAATIEQFAALADAVTATQGALTDLRKGVLPLGGIFANVASLSGDALYQLTEFAGGIEAFAAQAAGFVRNYYSADEQAAIQAGSVFSALTASGLNLAGLNTREEYRALVESRDLATEQGRQQLAVLLAQADAFSQISDYLAANGGTLYSLSQQAPSNDISGLLGPGTGGSGTASVGLDAVVTAVTDSNAQVVDAIDRLAENITAGLAQVAGNTQRSTDYLRDIYEDGTGGGGS